MSIRTDRASAAIAAHEARTSSGSVIGRDATGRAARCRGAASVACHGIRCAAGSPGAAGVETPRGKEEQVRKRIGRPSPALVISVIALVVAVAGGGSAIADGVARAAKLVTGSQIKNGSVTSADVKNGSLLRSDFKASERARLIGPEGKEGPKGQAGPQGSTGRRRRDRCSRRRGACGHGSRLRARDGHRRAQSRQERAVRLASHHDDLLRRA